MSLEFREVTEYDIYKRKHSGAAYGSKTLISEQVELSNTRDALREYIAEDKEYCDGD